MLILVKNFFKKGLITVFIVLFLVACNKNETEQDNRLKARINGWDYWVQAINPKSQNGLQGKIFGEFNNRGKYKATIQKITVDNIKGLAKMVKVDSSVSPKTEAILRNGFQIRAKKTLVLQPSGSYIGLYDLEKNLEEGDIVKVTLEFYGGRILKVEAEVKPYP